MFDLIQNTKPSIYLNVSDDCVDTSDQDVPMVSCTVQWVWQDDKDNFATLETYGIVAPPKDGVVDIDTLHYDFSDCTGSYSCDLTQEEELALDALMCNRACDVTLCWYDRDYQMTITAPLCRIGIPEEGKGYDIRTLYWGGTSSDWDYYISVADLSIDEEIALQDLMDDKMAWYDPLKGGYTLATEHY